MICPNCNHNIQRGNKTKDYGQWKHKQCSPRKKPKPNITKENLLLIAEKRENPVKKFVRVIRLRYGWT